MVMQGRNIGAMLAEARAELQTNLAMICCTMARMKHNIFPRGWPPHASENHRLAKQSHTRRGRALTPSPVVSWSCPSRLQLEGRSTSLMADTDSLILAFGLYSLDICPIACVYYCSAMDSQWPRASLLEWDDNYCISGSSPRSTWLGWCHNLEYVSLCYSTATSALLGV